MPGEDSALHFAVLQQFWSHLLFATLQIHPVVFFFSKLEGCPSSSVGSRWCHRVGIWICPSGKIPPSPVSCGEPACPAREPQKPQAREPPKSSFRKNWEGLGFEMLLSTFLPGGMRGRLGWAPTRALLSRFGFSRLAREQGLNSVLFPVGFCSAPAPSSSTGGKICALPSSIPHPSNV